MATQFDEDVPIHFVLVDEDGHRTPLPARYRYRRDDPYAVYLHPTDDNEDGENDWIFSLDILREGLHGPTGLHDVMAWPEIHEGRKFVMLKLSNHDEHCLLAAPAADVRTFLERTGIFAIDSEELRPTYTMGQLNARLTGLGLTPRTYSQQVPYEPPTAAATPVSHRRVVKPTSRATRQPKGGRTCSR